MSTNRMLLFRRQEIKYLVDRTTRTALSKDLQAFMQPDKFGAEDGGYYVSSMYFDSEDYLAYHEKMSGAAVRHKLRIRAYGQDPSTTPHVRLEVKSRNQSFIHKITVDVTQEVYRQIESAFQRRILPPTSVLHDDSVSKEFFRLQRQYNMIPRVIIQYRRQAFERHEMSRVRANFDDELLATRRLDLLKPLSAARRLLKYGHAIFELKVDGVMPYWMNMLIAKYNLQNRAISKFCYAVRSEARLSTAGRAADGL